MLENYKAKYKEYFREKYLRFIKLFRWIYIHTTYTGVLPHNLTLYKLIGIKIKKINFKQEKLIYPVPDFYNEPGAVAFHDITAKRYRFKKNKEYLLFMSDIVCIGNNAYPAYKNMILFETTRDNTIKETIHKPNDILNVSETCFINSGKFCDHYGHFMCDMMPRFRLLEHLPPEERPKKYIMRANLGFQRDLLGLMGIKTDQIIEPQEDHIIKVKNAIIPAYTSLTRFGYTNPEDIFYLRKKILPAVQPVDTAYQKIYITRQHAPGGRNLKNENELFLLLEKYGVKVVQPLDYSVIEQISMFNTAHLIIAAGGSALVNCIFCNLRATIVELVPSSFLHPHTYLMSLALGIKHFTLIGEVTRENENNRYADFSISIPELEKILVEWEMRNITDSLISKNSLEKNN